MRGVKHLFDGNGLIASIHLDNNMSFKFNRVGGATKSDDNRIFKEDISIGTHCGYSGLAIFLLSTLLQKICYHTYTLKLERFSNNTSIVYHRNSTDRHL